MWNTIVLLVRKAFLKNKLKKEEKKANQNGLQKKSNKKVKKIKLQIFGINISLTITLVSATIMVLVFAMMLFTLLSFMGAISGNSILNRKDDTADEDDPEKNWTFDNYNIYDPDSGVLNISGGIYPKDPILKNRALILEIYKISAEDAAQRYGITIPPEYIFGIMIRETGGYKLFEAIDANKNTDWLTKLTYDNPACNKGSSSCNYMKAGVSHFVGGTVVNGKDTGNPGTMAVNNQNAVIKQTGGHALGYMQWEIPYIESRTADLKADGVLFPVSRLGIDESALATIDRPNYFYMPDTICLTTNFVVKSIKGLGSPNYTRVINYSGYNKLDDRNKAFILFCMEQTYYAGGGLFENGADLCIELIDLVNDGKIQYLDHLFDPLGATFYNTSTHKAANDRHGDWFEEWFKGYYGIKASVSNKSNILYGIYAACAGRSAWDLMTAEVDAAEKEQIVMGGNTGRWIDYVGSGKFAPIATAGKNYYHEGIQATVFHQTKTAGTTDYREDSWRTTTVTPGGSTYGAAGCGVYSTAFAITNLTGTLVTPVDIKQYFTEHGLPAWMDNIQDAARAYGLDASQKKKSEVSTAQAFESWAISELQNGAQIINVWKDSSGGFKWYQGGGHYMVIRGYNKSNNYFRVFTSAGVNGRGTFDTVCQIELPASDVVKYLSNGTGSNYDFVVIKPKGGVASLGDSSTGGGQPVAGTNFIGTMGAGTFGNPKSSQYYSPSLQAILYPQSSVSTAGSRLGLTYPSYATTIQKKTYYSDGGNGSYGAAGSGSNWGCPAYAASALLSNLLGVEILPDALPGTSTATSPWSTGGSVVAKSGYGNSSFVTTLKSVNSTLSSQGMGYQLNYKELTREQLAAAGANLYKWLDSGAMLYARIPNSSCITGSCGSGHGYSNGSCGGAHSIVICGYDKSTYSNGNYTLKLINSIVGNSGGYYPYLDRANGQTLPVDYINSKGIAECFRNWGKGNSGYAVIVVWRSDVAASLPGL